MNFYALWDPASVAVVLGGTLFATALRAGIADLGATVLLLATLTKKPFDYSAARAEIAADVEDIRHDGVLRAPENHSSDREIADATDALIRHRSLQAAMDEHERHKQIRLSRQRRASLTLLTAADLAPVFGLAGTLLALTQVETSLLDGGDLVGAIGMAVLSTLYGLLFAHLVLMPLARLIERRAETEEVDRQHMFDWLASQLAGACQEARQPPRNTGQ